MIQRDKIMENLMNRKHYSSFFIDKTTSMKTDKNGNVISSNDRYRVSPSLPSETDIDAEKKEAELNSGIGIITNNTTLTSFNVWNEIWANIDLYLDNFFKDKQKGKNRVSDNTIKNMQSGFKYLKLFCVKGITPNLKFYKELQNSMEMLPVDYLRGKKWSNVSIKDIEKNFDNSNYETLNPKTINKHLNFHKQFFNWLDYNEDTSKYKTNMFKLLPLFEEDEIVKFEYNKEDLQKIFNTDLNKNARDFFMVSLYTGMRLSEICNLTKTNIKDNCIYIFDGKTKNAIRIIPIHKEIENIFTEKIANTKLQYLFYDGNSSATGKKLNRILKNIINDKSKSLHSFRKSFSQALEDVKVGEEKYREFLMGHSISTVRQKNYNLGKMNVDMLRDIISHLEINIS